MPSASSDGVPAAEGLGFVPLRKRVYSDAAVIPKGCIMAVAGEVPLTMKVPVIPPPTPVPADSTSACRLRLMTRAKRILDGLGDPEVVVSR